MVETTLILTEELREMEEAAAATEAKMERCLDVAERAVGEAKWQAKLRETERQAILGQLAAAEQACEKAEQILRKVRQREKYERSRAAYLVSAMFAAAFGFCWLICVNWAYIWAALAFLLGGWGVASVSGLTFKSEERRRRSHEHRSRAA